MKAGLIIVLVLVGSQLRAQSVEDLVRMTSNQNAFSSARAGALGSSFVGISDDASSGFYNPAGLSLLRSKELGAGLQMFRVNQETSFFDQQASSSEHSLQPSFLAYAAPSRIGRDPAGYSISFNSDQDYRASRSYSAFNPLSSIVPSLLNDGGSQTENLLYKVHVADIINGRLESPVSDSLIQSASITEDGSKGSLIGSFGFQLSKTASLGFSIGGVWHHYTYVRSYSERDIANKYNLLDTSSAFSNLDLNSLAVIDHLDQSASALYLRVGLMAFLGEWGRLSVAISPSLRYSVSETFSRSAVATFDDNPSYQYRAASDGRNEYSVYSPWDFILGFSAHVEGLTCSVSARYQDYTTAGFGNELSYLSELNDSIRVQLREQFEWSVGAEYKIPLLPVFARASVTSATSMYNDAFTSDGSVTTMGCGLGVLLDKHFRLDATARFSSLKGNFSLYGNGSDASYSLNSKPSVYALQLCYRY